MNRRRLCASALLLLLPLAAWAQPPPPGGRPPPGPAGAPPGFRPIHGRSPYRYPRGYSYRRWVVGDVLPAVYVGHRYAFNDFRTAGLGRPPPGQSWIRVGPDLLLVRLTSRRITQVIYNAFL